MYFCTVCGDAYKGINAARDNAREEAKIKSDEAKEPFCIYEEAGKYFTKSYWEAITDGSKIVEIVSRLSDTA